jgi:nucleoside-diphosphate kinase
MRITPRLTLALFKPDLTANFQKIDKILKTLQNHNFQILRLKTILWRTKEAANFYEEHRGKFFFERMIGFMTSGYIMACILEKEDAVNEWRKLLGPTHPCRARMLMPNSLRALYGSTDTRNSFHGSDTWENAKREIEFCFPEFNYEEYLQETLRKSIS